MAAVPGRALDESRRYFPSPRSTRFLTVIGCHVPPRAVANRPREGENQMATREHAILTEPVLLTDAEMNKVAGGTSIFASLLGCPKQVPPNHFENDAADTGTCEQVEVVVDTGTCPPS
jgi:hypothetical protein